MKYNIITIIIIKIYFLSIKDLLEVVFNPLPYLSVEGVRKEQSLNQDGGETLSYLLKLKYHYLKRKQGGNCSCFVKKGSSAPKIVTHTGQPYPLTAKVSGSQLALPTSGFHFLFRLSRMEIELVAGRLWMGKVFYFISKACAGISNEAVPSDLSYVTQHKFSSHSHRVTMSKPCGHVTGYSPFALPDPFSIFLHPALCLGGLSSPKAASRLPFPLVSG